MNNTIKKIFTSLLAILFFTAGLTAKDKVNTKNAESIIRPPLLRMAENGYTLIWNTDSQELPKVTLKGNKTKTELTPKRCRVNYKDSGFYVDLTNLEPCQNYTVKISKYKSVTFTAPPKEDQGFTFAGISDHQTHPEYTEIGFKAVKNEKPDCIISAGDMLEDGKVKNWKANFFDKISILEGIPFGCAQGNNDTGFQLFSSYLALSERYYTSVYGNTRFIFLDSNQPMRPETEQIIWLESVLKQNTSHWTIVVYHHSSYVSSEPDYSSTKNREVITSLFEKYGVDMVINGHVHFYERTKPINGIHYVTLPTMSGNPARVKDNDSTPYFCKMVRDFLGYGVFTVTNQKISAQIKDLDGKIVDTFEIEK